MAPRLTASAAGPNEADLSGSSSAIWGFWPSFGGVVKASGGSATASGKVFATGVSASGVDAAGVGALGAGAAMGRPSITGAGFVEVAQPLFNAANRIIRKAAIRCIRKITRQAKTYYM